MKRVGSELIRIGTAALILMGAGVALSIVVALILHVGLWTVALLGIVLPLAIVAVGFGLVVLGSRR